jgi:hypothetical protein
VNLMISLMAYEKPACVNNETLERAARWRDNSAARYVCCGPTPTSGNVCSCAAIESKADVGS